MMQRNKVSLERQFDERLYQFLCPNEGNWNEVERFALDIAGVARMNIDTNEKKTADAKAAAEASQSEAPTA